MIDIKFQECCNHCANLEVECNYANLYKGPIALIGCSHMDVCSEYKKAVNEELKQRWNCDTIQCGRLAKAERDDNPLKEQCDVQTRMVVHEYLDYANSLRGNHENGTIDETGRTIIQCNIDSKQIYNAAKDSIKKESKRARKQKRDMFGEVPLWKR